MQVESTISSLKLPGICTKIEEQIRHSIKYYIIKLQKTKRTMNSKELKEEMKNLPIRAVYLDYGRVFVQYLPAPEIVSAGGIQQIELHDETTKIALMVSMPDRFKDPKNNPDNVKEGDIVIVNHQAGNKLKIPFRSATEHPIFAMWATDILAVWTQAPEDYYNMISAQREADRRKNLGLPESEVETAKDPKPSEN